ncbi:MAG: Gfo/Idh/MocA family oxidoreductase [Candidatus Latescibacteria bacterium]|nr:Gfo/Idh/MocA family oxidoreductase [Candidatus Latescibacterota bacterium]
MGDKIRVAVIGCGGMGRHHVEVVQGMDGFEVAALCDVSAEALEKIGDQHQIPARYEDCEKMFDEVSPDIAAVATQTRGHCGPVVAALRRGISVLCEKPIAIDLAEADQMVEAGRASGARLAINQQNHLNPGIRKARELVAQGLIGEVVLVRGRNKAGRKSGNEFMEMGTHVTDMMLRFGSMPQWCAGTVYAQGRLAGPQDIMEAKEMSPRDRDSGLVMGERALAHYGFAGGVLGEIHFIDYPKTMGANYGVDLLGTEGQLAVRASGHVGQNLWYLPRPMEGQPADLGDWQAMDLSDMGAESPIALMYRGLAEAAAGVEPPGSGEEGRWAFEMIMAIYQSHREGGRRVELPLADRRHPLETWRAQG